MADNKSVHHIVPFDVLIKTGAALFCLTILTMTAFWYKEHLGAFAAPVAFLIAAVKAVLVMLFFMGLRWESWLNRTVFGLGFIFLSLLYLMTITDIVTRVKEISPL